MLNKKSLEIQKHWYFILLIADFNYWIPKKISTHEYILLSNQGSVQRLNCLYVSVVGREAPPSHLLYVCKYIYLLKVTQKIPKKPKGLQTP